MNARNIHERFRSGQYTQSDLQSVIDALASGDNDFLDQTVFQYIKRVEIIDEESLIRYLKTAQTGQAAYAVSEIIAGLSNRGTTRQDFVEEVSRFASGVAWDNQEIARLSAVFALPRVTKCSVRVKSILRAAHQAGNSVVRNAALTSAQLYFGIPEKDVLRGKDEHDITDKMPKGLLEWLAAETQ